MLVVKFTAATKKTKVKINGQIVTIDEKQLPPGVKIPYRMIPGKIAVRK